MDALSDVLRAIRLSGGLFFQVEARAPFGVIAMEHAQLRHTYARGAEHVVPFHLVTHGACWFDGPDGARARMAAGDIVVVPSGATHAFVDAPGRRPTPVPALLHLVTGRPPTLRHGGEGDACGILCGFFRWHGRVFNPLFAALPPWMLIRSDPTRTPWLAATLQRAYREDGEERPGAAALVERLTELLFVEVVQGWLRENEGRGWLSGLRDPLVARALGHMHAEPARDWTVDALARAVGASRTTLAERFRATLDMSVIEYLTRWRMELAADRLLTTDRSVAEVAAEVGYQSEASLNRAFKRHAGQPPASWRRARLERAAPA